ncbi:MAG TPA: MaoC family dehydratase N-terminal domain-containing protein [Solirubrobacteraceae bacterium]
MAINTETIGKTYAPLLYAVGREKIREFAAAVGETNPLHSDLEAARAAGYDDLVAPPMFAVVYAGASVTPALFDPEVGIDFAMLVHGRQDFRWGRVVVAGDEITTTTTIKDITSRGGLGFYEFETESKDAGGVVVCTGLWTNIVRGAE